MIRQTFRKINSRSFQIMKYFQTPQKVSPGRWTIETCQKKIFTKTDYSNEDHCGTCHKKKQDLYQEDDENLKYYFM